MLQNTRFTSLFSVCVFFLFHCVIQPSQFLTVTLYDNQLTRLKQIRFDIDPTRRKISLQESEMLNMLDRAAFFIYMCVISS